MALFFSKHVAGPHRIPTPSAAGEVVAVRFGHLLTTAQHVTGNIVELGVLPANCTVVDAIFDADDIDSATTLELDIGLMSGLPGETLDEQGNARTCGDELFDGITTGRSAGVERLTLPDAFRIAASDKDRGVGLKIVAQGTAVEGNVGLTLLIASR